MRLAPLVAGCLMTIAAAPAAAQDLAAADALFQRGLADMQAGRYDTGCPALAESHRLDPRAGRLFTLAECEAKQGKLATAFARYGDYLATFARMTPAEQAKQMGRDKISQQQRAALAPLVPELTLALAPGAPRGTIVKRDDVELAAPSLGVPLPVDPGDHVVTTQAPGGPVTELRITIAKGEKKQVTLEVQGPLSPGAAAPPPPAPGPRADAPAPPIAPAPDEGPGGRRVAAYVIGGVGLAALALGGVTGALALGKSGTASDHCEDADGGVAICDREGKEAGDSAKTLGLVSTIGFGVGLAGVGAAAVLLLTEPSAPTESAWVGAGVLHAGPAGAAVGVRGAW